MTMTAAQWKTVWSPNHLMAAVDRPELPPVARSFLRTHGLPKILVVEVVGDNAAMDFEWSFRLLKKELVSYTQMLRWGNRDPVRDRLWSNQMVIGEEEFCNGRAAICVHATEEYVSRIDCELPAPRDLGLFINSNLPKFGECVLAAVQWAAEHQHSQKGRRRALYAELVDVAGSNRSSYHGFERTNHLILAKHDPWRI